MDYLTSIQNLLQYLNNNWFSLIIIFVLTILIVLELKSYIKLLNEEKISVAKKQIKEIIPKLVVDAEENYCLWKNAGLVKRAQVIDEIFEKYPVLSKVTNQEQLIAWIDEIIDEALKTMRVVFESQQEM